MRLVSRRLALAGTLGAAGAIAGCAASRDADDRREGAPGPGEAEDAAEPESEPEDDDGHRVVAAAQLDGLAFPADDAGSLEVGSAVLETATAAVVSDDATAEAADLATSLGLPLLLARGAVTEELDRLGTRTVITLGAVGDLGDREVVDGAGEIDVEGLPLTPGSADAVALHVTGRPISRATRAILASAGITLTEVEHDDPRATAETVEAAKSASAVVGIGSFGERFAPRLEAARTLPELPGGGVAPFPGRMMIALYGHPGAPVLGVMGEQGPNEAAALAKQFAAEYQELVEKPVIGCFEIITTIASASAGADGNYSSRSSIEHIQPFVDAAEEHGLYAVLDLQPGHMDFLTQAKLYEELLLRPHVGLALDPEWRLRPGQRHMTIIGQVEIDEVNATGAWLADLVAEHRLPPKVLVLHQFQTRMIIDRHRLDTSRDEVQYLMHADGHGNHGQKLATWNALLPGLDENVRLGWKNFIDEDTPMMTPAQTVQLVHPTPDFISYQ